MLIGNKTDLEHRRVVSFQEAGRVGFSYCREWHEQCHAYTQDAFLNGNVS